MYNWPRGEAGHIELHQCTALSMLQPDSTQPASLGAAEVETPALTETQGRPARPQCLCGREMGTMPGNGTGLNAVEHTHRVM